MGKIKISIPSENLRFPFLACKNMAFSHVFQATVGDRESKKVAAEDILRYMDAL